MLAIVADPDTLGNVCGEIMEGGTLLDVAQKWDVKYGHLHEWIHDENHPERIKAYARAMEARASYIRDRVIRGLLRFEGLDLSKAFNKNGKMLPVHKLPEDVRHALQQLELVQDKKGNKVTKLRTVDKLGASTLLARTQGMLHDKVDVKHSGTVGLADRLNSARTRVIEGTSKPVEVPPDPNPEIPKL